MIKLSVSETKWSSLLARTRALTLYISILIFDFGPEKLPGLSRNGSQANKILDLITESSSRKGLIMSSYLKRAGSMNAGSCF